MRQPSRRSPIRQFADIGAAILARRIEVDATRRQIETALGWPRNLLRAIEQGRKSLNETTMEPLLDLLALRLILRDDAGHEIACSSYHGLIVALISRRHALNLSQEAVNFIAGVQDGYIGKLECGVRRLGPVSLPAILGALRLQLFVEPRPAHRWRFPEPADIAAFASYILLPAPAFQPEIAA